VVLPVEAGPLSIAQWIGQSNATTNFGFATLKGASTLGDTCGEEVPALTAAP
jgi:hypothetical protein